MTISTLSYLRTTNRYCNNAVHNSLYLSWTFHIRYLYGKGWPDFTESVRNIKCTSIWLWVLQGYAHAAVLAIIWQSSFRNFSHLFFKLVQSPMISWLWCQIITSISCWHYLFIIAHEKHEFHLPPNWWERVYFCWSGPWTFFFSSGK